MVYTHILSSVLISKIPPLKQKEIKSDNAIFNALTTSTFSGVLEIT